MRQLSFDNGNQKINFIEQIEDLRLYLKALDGITATILRDLKKKNRSIISVETLASVVYSVATECNYWAAYMMDKETPKEADQPKNFPTQMAEQNH